MSFEISLRSSIFLLFIVGLCYMIYSRLARKPNLPDLPWVNVEEGKWFPRSRARFTSTFQHKGAIEYAYEHYSKKGLSCIIPSLSGDVILLPATMTDWIITQPDASLNTLEAHIEGLQTDYTFADPDIVRSPHHEHIVRTDLTRQLGNLTEDIMDELAAGFDETWGFDTSNWKDIVVFENMMRIIARTSNRIFVGLPLCRNKKYLDYAAGYAQAIIPAASILRQFPKSLRPAVSYIATLPNKYYIKKIANFLDPEIKRRLADIDRKSNDPEEKATPDEPNDFMQWMIRYAQSKLPASELSPRMIAGRLLALNFAAIHTSTFSITNVIFDLVSADPSLNYLGQLREEAAAVLAEDNGVWTKKGLGKMYKIDSALRDSLRVRSFLSLGLVRLVTAPEGVTAPNGTYCPFGSSVGIAAYGVHNDDAIFPNATTFNALRYVDARDAVTASATDPTTGKLERDGLIKKANYGVVSTSADYQPFGHGRHACPGRFFAANELKLLLAYMVLNYDIELQDKRPEGRWVAQISLPPMTATIRVRRRKVDAK